MSIQRTFLSFLCLLMLFGSGNLYAQQAPDPAAQDPGQNPEQGQQAEVATGSAFWRLGFFEMTQQTFTTPEDHPFYQMTGSDRFRGGKGSFTIPTLDNWNIEDLLLFKNKRNIQDSNQGATPYAKEQILTHFMHSLPPFSLEYIVPTDFGVSFSGAFTYTNTWLTDIKAKNPTTGNDANYTTPLLFLRSHYYLFSASVYPLGQPQQGGIDFFYGVGLAQVESNIHTGIRQSSTNWAGKGTGFASDVAQLDFSSGMLSFQRMGINSSGNSFGFTLEFFFLDDTKILDNPFKTKPLISSRAYNAMYNQGNKELPEKASMKGAIMRAAMMWSFW